MDAAVKRRTLAFPGGAITAGFIVHLEYLRMIAVQLRIAASRQAKEAPVIKSAAMSETV
jgi:hypothetical protein